MNQVPKIVQQRMAAKPRPENHPGAEVLAAFSQDAMGKSERAEIFAHLSQCPECREIVFLAQPELDVSRVYVPQPEKSVWSRLPAWRWAAATACVIVIGSALFQVKEHPENGLTAANQATTQIAQLNALPSSQKKASEPGANAAGTVAEAVPAKVSASNSPTSVAANTSAGATESLAGAQGFASLDTSRYSAVRSSNLPRWTLTSHGTLERSLDSGKTWQAVTIEQNTSTLHAVTALGPQIWVGGSKGALFHSADAGHSWSRVKPAADKLELTADIIGIEFADPLNGQLRTSSGKIWITSDGGKIWKLK